MPLTVKDILEKTFKRSFKGYDEDEVDRFLDQIIDEFKVLQGENESLKSALTEANERVSRISETEATIMNTLVSAQKSSERMLAEAARKAELIIDSAQTTAHRRAEQTMSELAEAEKRLEDIKARAAQFAESFANMINSQAASFDQAYRSYFGESEATGGIAAEATRRIGADVENGLKDIGVIGGSPGRKAPDEAPDVAPDTLPERNPAELPGMPPTELPGPSPVELPNMPPGELPEPGKDLMSLQEINRALSELEEQDGSILGDDDEKESAYKPRYDDYSWLYDSGDAGKDDGIAGKDDETLKSLIDEVIDK